METPGPIHIIPDTSPLPVPLSAISPQVLQSSNYLLLPLAPAEEYPTHNRQS